MKKIILSPLRHREGLQIAVTFAYNAEVREHLKKFKGMKWSRTHQTFYVAFTVENKNALYHHLNSKQWFVDYSQLKGLKEEKPPVLSKKESFSQAQKKILHEYVAYLRGKRLSESSVRTYYTFIEKFISFIGDKSLTEIQNRDIELFIEQKIAAKNYSLSTHRQVVSALRQFGALYPFTQVDPQKIHQPPRGKYLPGVLSKEEAIALLQATRNLKHRAVLAMLYSCGLRIGELRNLKLREIDFQRRQVFIKNSKGRKDRVLVLAESILPLLNNYLNTYRPTELFAEGRDGQKYAAESIRSALRASCKHAGITKQVTPHTLRHSYATHMLENGIDIRYIQELLGHSRPETTMIYTHVSRKDILKIESPLDVTLKELLGNDKDKQNIVLSRNLNR